MKLTLLEVSAHPGQIAVTRIGTCSQGGVFFLDFSRPLRTERWFLVWNSHLGYPLALHVPVVHEGEVAGSRSIAVERSEPYFGELLRLWRSRHPTNRKPPTAHAEETQVADDFSLHFPMEGPARERTAA
jgi:hypothetical protein